MFLITIYCNIDYIDISDKFSMNSRDYIIHYDHIPTLHFRKLLLYLFNTNGIITGISIIVDRNRIAQLPNQRYNIIITTIYSSFP